MLVRWVRWVWNHVAWRETVLGQRQAEPRPVTRGDRIAALVNGLIWIVFLLYMVCTRLASGLPLSRAWKFLMVEFVIIDVWAWVHWARIRK